MTIAAISNSNNNILSTMSWKYTVLFILCILIDKVKPRYEDERFKRGGIDERLGDQDEVSASQSPVNSLANSITTGLTNSDVLGDHAKFTIDATEVYGIFYRVSVRFLAAAGIVDDELARLAAQAGEEIGLVKSELYFAAVGLQVAKFFDYIHYLWDGKVDFLALSVVSSIEIEACRNGLTDTESTLNAVVYGLHRMLEKFDLVNYHTMKLLFYLFSEEIVALSDKY